MVCQKCKTQSVYEFTNKAKVCRECFMDYFERKIFRIIRKYQMSLLNIAGDKKDVRYKILKLILEKIKINRKSKAKITTGIKNLDDFSAEIISGVMSRGFNIKDFLPKTKNQEVPLYFMPDREILLYAKLKKIRVGIKRNENRLQKEINSLFSELEKNDRDVRHAVVNARMKL